MKDKNCEDYLFTHLDAVFYVVSIVLSTLTILTNLEIIIYIYIYDYSSLYYSFCFTYRKIETHRVKQILQDHTANNWSWLEHSESGSRALAVKHYIGSF